MKLNTLLGQRVQATKMDVLLADLTGDHDKATHLMTGGLPLAHVMAAIQKLDPEHPIFSLEVSDEIVELVAEFDDLYFKSVAEFNADLEAREGNDGVFRIDVDTEATA